MIVVTRLNQSHFAVNPDLIERIHENPDTTLVLVDGTTFIVTETMDEVIDKIANYRARVIQLASRPIEYPNLGVRHLEAVPDEAPREPRKH